MGASFYRALFVFGGDVVRQANACAIVGPVNNLQVYAYFSFSYTLFNPRN